MLSKKLLKAMCAAFLRLPKPDEGHVRISQTYTRMYYTLSLDGVLLLILCYQMSFIW